MTKSFSILVIAFSSAPSMTITLIEGNMLMRHPALIMISHFLEINFLKPVTQIATNNQGNSKDTENRIP